LLENITSLLFEQEEEIGMKKVRQFMLVLLSETYTKGEKATRLGKLLK
jgi:hypothetical protein